MIKSYANKHTEQIAKGEFAKKIPHSIHRAAKMKLDRIKVAVTLDDLRVPPSHNLERLSGKRKHQHSIRINRQWRVVFTWKDGNAHDVEIVDYH